MGGGNARRLDASQNDAVGATANAVVSAGAGSGKTTVLAERYLRIVKEGRADVEQILTLTYTRKAAAEMYERIYTRLREESDDPTIKEQLARFDRAQISTLDSFCVQILRNAPQQFGIRADFSIGDDQGRRLVEETALEFLLDNSDDPALLSFIGLNGFEAVWTGFFASLGSSYLHLARERDFLALYHRQIEALERIVSQTAAKITETGRKLLAIDRSAAKAVADAHARLASLPDLATMAGEMRFEEIGKIAEELSFSKRTGGSSSPEVLLYKELVAELDRMKEDLARACLTLASRETLRRLFELCGEFQALLFRRKRSTGALSFQDVMELAVRLLTENRALRRYYKRRYRYLMIDEFQDNNELQKRLLYLLAERPGEESAGSPGADRVEAGKLFFVGDQKQSIYRFRGADVTVFRGLASELEASGGHAISLATNYRSDPHLIDFYNRFFAQVFADPREDFEARFELLSPGVSDGNASTVRLFYRPYDDAAGGDEAHSDDAEAYHIARFIKASVEEGSLPVRDGAASRPATWDDFALLMRTTSNQIRYEKIFRRLAIPYTTQSVRTLFLEAPLNDFYAALQLAIYPDDRTAYAALLRSPLVNLSDPSVVELLLLDCRPFAELPTAVADLARERDKFAAGRELYERLCGLADVAPIARLVDELWYRYGYRYNILADPANHPYLEYYDYFRKLAADADEAGRTLAEFLDLIRPNLGKYEKLPELEIVRDQAAGVQLLTIHKAKGLEFPVVIVANTGNMGRTRQEGRQPYYLSDEYGLTLRVTDRGNYFYLIAEEEARRKEHAELKRLLYVALTRAKSHLVISGCHNRQNRTDGGVLLNMVLGVLEAEGVSGPAGEEHSHGKFADVERVLIPPVSEAELMRRRTAPARARIEKLLDHYAEGRGVERRSRKTIWGASQLSAYLWARLTEPSPERGLFPGAEGLPAAFAAARPLPALESDPVVEELGVEATFGALVHAVVERRLSQPAKRVEAAEVPARLLRGIPAASIGVLVGDANALAEGFLATALGARAARAVARSSERKFLYRPMSDCYVRGVFDLLFADDEGCCVVDFKTDRELQPAAHAAQLHAYRLAARELEGREVTSWLLYLRSGEAVEVGEELLGPLYRQFFDVAGTEITGDALEWGEGGENPFAAFVAQAAADPQAAGEMPEERQEGAET